MSRTYRRKNCHDEYYSTYEWEYDKSVYCRYKRFLVGKELKKALAIFHSDASFWNWQIPSDFVRDKNRELRSKNKAILRRAIRDDNDEPVFIPHLKNAAYDYW